MTTIRGNPYDITGLGIDADFVADLPDELREEIIMTSIAERRSQSVATGSQPSEIDQGFLDALPDDIRDEIIQQERQDRRRREREERNRAAESLINRPNNEQPAPASSITTKKNRGSKLGRVLREVEQRATEAKERKERVAKGSPPLDKNNNNSRLRRKAKAKTNVSTSTIGESSKQYQPTIPGVYVSDSDDSAVHNPLLTKLRLLNNRETRQRYNHDSEDLNSLKLLSSQPDLTLGSPSVSRAWTPNNFSRPTGRARERNPWSGVKGLPPPNLDQLNEQLPPLDLSSISSGDYNSLQNRDARDGFSAIPDHEQLMFSAGSSTSTTTLHPQARSTPQGFPELKSETTMRDRFLKEAQRISGLPIPTGISGGRKRIRDEDDRMPISVPRSRPPAPGLDLGWERQPQPGLHPGRLKREIVEIV
jgi:hypothetical protein